MKTKTIDAENRSTNNNDLESDVTVVLNCRDNKIIDAEAEQRRAYRARIASLSEVIIA